MLGLLGATGCSATASTPDDLARAVVGYLASGDFDGYLADTVMTSTQAFDVCPATKEFSLDVSSFRQHFDTCREGFDFTDASVTTVSPKLETFAAGDKSCGNEAPVNGVKSIDVTVEGKAGTYDFQIDDSMETPDGWRQYRPLRCIGSTPNCDAFALAIDVCCAKPNADQGPCASLKSSIQAAKELASELGTDCGTSVFTCPWD